LMGGNVGVDSVFGHGATFWFTARLALSTRVADAGQTLRSAGAPLGTADDAGLAALRGARVLLVEDNEINQLVATELLRQAGLVVDVAENGAVGIAVADGAELYFTAFFLAFLEAEAGRFRTEDLEQYGTKTGLCRARLCLGSLRPRPSRRHKSWRRWTWVER